MAQSTSNEDVTESEMVRRGVHPTSIPMGVVAGAFLGTKNMGMYVQWEVAFRRESDESKVVFLAGMCMDSSWNNPAGKVCVGSKCTNFLPQGDIPFGTFETLMDDDGEHWIKFKLPRSEELTWAKYTEVQVISEPRCLGKRKQQDTYAPRDIEDARTQGVPATCGLGVVTHETAASAKTENKGVGSTHAASPKDMSILHESDYDESSSDGRILGDSDYESDDVGVA
jgi:hypothetical protein